MTGFVADRILDLLDLLAEEAHGLPLSEICRRLTLPKSAAHRLLSVLTKRGYAVQDELTERYRLTVKLAALGFRFLAHQGLPEIFQPLLDKLAARTGELVRLALVDNGALTWVAKAQGALSGLKYDPDMGTPVVLHATATGRSWLATLDEAEAVRLVEAHGYAVPDRFGVPIVHDTPSLRRELEATRIRGYGLAIDEGERGTAAIACVVRADRDPAAPAVGTVSIAGPIARLTRERLALMASDLQATAAEVSMLWPTHRFRADRPPPRQQTATPVASPR